MEQAGDVILQKLTNEIFNPLYQFVVACTLVYFLYGITMFIYNMNDPEKKNTGKMHLLWGTVGMVIIFSVGGILTLFNTLFSGMFSS